MLTQESMENVQKTRRLFASAYGCKASRSFLIWSLSAAMSISVARLQAHTVVKPAVLFLFGACRPQCP